MTQELKVIADFYDFMLWLIQHTEKFPRLEVPVVRHMNRMMMEGCIRSGVFHFCLLAFALCPSPFPARADVGCGEAEVFAVDNRYASADFNQDDHVDADDVDTFEACATGSAIAYNAATLPDLSPGCTLTPDGNGRIAADSDKRVTWTRMTLASSSDATAAHCQPIRTVPAENDRNREARSDAQQGLMEFSFPPRTGVPANGDEPTLNHEGSTPKKGTRIGPVLRPPRGVLPAGAM